MPTRIRIWISKNPIAWSWSARTCCIAHPILWERVLRNRHRPEIIVVDPRRTETAMQSTQHFAIAPKSDPRVFLRFGAYPIDQDWVGPRLRRCTHERFEEFAAFVAEFTPERVAAVTGVGVERLHALARTLHERKRVSFSVDDGSQPEPPGCSHAQSLINLALMTGNMGRPGTGANSITGQCNAMGSRLFSNTTNLLGVGRDFEKREDRESVASVLGISVDRIPDRKQLAYPEIHFGNSQGKDQRAMGCRYEPRSFLDQSKPVPRHP